MLSSGKLGNLEGKSIYCPWKEGTFIGPERKGHSLYSTWKQHLAFFGEKEQSVINPGGAEQWFRISFVAKLYGI